MNTSIAARCSSPEATLDDGRRTFTRQVGIDEARTIQVDVLAEVLDHLEQGIIVVDRHARVLFASRPAKDILRTGGPTMRQGTLVAQTARETAALHAMIADCVSQERTSATTCLTRGDEEPVLAIVVPGGRVAQASTGPLAIVFLVDPSQTSAPTPDHLQQQFDLTRAEAALASEIAKGDGISACSDRLGIMDSTARTHLRHIFEKTGTTRQAELVWYLYTRRHPLRSLLGPSGAKRLPLR